MREVDLYSVVVDDHARHREVCPLAIVPSLKSYEGVLKRIARLPISHQVHVLYIPKSFEDLLQSILIRDTIKLAYEYHSIPCLTLIITQSFQYNLFSSFLVVFNVALVSN